MRFLLPGLLALLAAAAACKEKPYLTCESTSLLEISSSGGVLELPFSVNRPWTAKSSGSWCVPEASSGEGGTVTLKLDCAPNTDHNPRTCVVSVSAEALTFSVSVSQQQAFMIIPSQSTVSIGSKGGPFSVSTRFNSSYTVRIDDCDWLSCTSSPTRTLLDGTESFTALPNYVTEERKAVIWFESDQAAASVEVVQEAYTHPVLQETAPGFYGFGDDLSYTPGQDQLGLVRTASGSTFRLLSPSTVSIGEISGIPSKPAVLEPFDCGVTLIRNSSVIYSADCQASVILTSGDLAWIILDEDKGIVAKI